MNLRGLLTDSSSSAGAAKTTTSVTGGAKLLDLVADDKRTATPVVAPTALRLALAAPQLAPKSRHLHLSIAAIPPDLAFFLLHHLTTFQRLNHNVAQSSRSLSPALRLCLDTSKLSIPTVPTPQSRASQLDLATRDATVLQRQPQARFNRTRNVCALD